MSSKTVEQKIAADERLSHEEFVLWAIDKLKSVGKDGKTYKGIHSVYSGFNEAFKAYFVGENPVTVTTDLKTKGVIDISFAKGGVMLYRKGDGPTAKEANATTALKKLGIVK